jgi:hypothetical protein
VTDTARFETFSVGSERPVTGNLRGRAVCPVVAGQRPSIATDPPTVAGGQGRPHKLNSESPTIVQQQVPFGRLDEAAAGVPPVHPYATDRRKFIKAVVT